METPPSDAPLGSEHLKKKNKNRYNITSVKRNVKDAGETNIKKTDKLLFYLKSAGIKEASPLCDIALSERQERRNR